MQCNLTDSQAEIGIIQDLRYDCLILYSSTVQHFTLILFSLGISTILRDYWRVMRLHTLVWADSRNPKQVFRTFFYAFQTFLSIFIANIVSTDVYVQNKRKSILIDQLNFFLLTCLWEKSFNWSEIDHQHVLTFET